MIFPMGTSRYEFQTNWSLAATIEEVSTILEDIENLSSWWPSVYLKVEVLDAGNDQGIGKRVRLWTKGWLPYTLSWTFTVTDNRKPHGFSLRAEGDFEGSGHWYLWQDGEIAKVRFDWSIAANKPLLKKLTPILRPIFAKNHEWAMAQGLKSLELEVQRRRGVQVESPPQPTWPHRAVAA